MTASISCVLKKWPFYNLISRWLLRNRIDSAMGTVGFLFCLCTWTTLCLGKRTGWLWIFFALELWHEKMQSAMIRMLELAKITEIHTYLSLLLSLLSVASITYKHQLCIFVVFKFIYVDTYGCTLILCIHTVINNYMLIGSVSIGFHLFHQSRFTANLGLLGRRF